MPRKPAPKPDNPEQFKRFQQTAREAGADQQDEAFDRVLDQVAQPKSISENRKPQRRKP